MAGSTLWHHGETKRNAVPFTRPTIRNGVPFINQVGDGGGDGDGDGHGIGERNGNGEGRRSGDGTAGGLPAQTRGRPAQREDPARRGRRGVRQIGCGGPRTRHRGRGRGGHGHDLPPLPDPRGPHHRRLPAPGGGLRRGRPALLASSPTPYAALASWIDLFVDFLVTKHGLAAVLQSDNAGFETLHAYFLDRLVPVCTDLLAAATDSGEIHTDVPALALMRGVGNLCIGAETPDPRYDARQLVRILIAGLRGVG